MRKAAGLLYGEKLVTLRPNMGTAIRTFVYISLCLLPAMLYGAEKADTVLPLNEVTVTAIKGGSRANADESVTVISPSVVSRLGIDNLKQAGEIAPNFYIPAYGSRMTSSVYVRGLGARIDQPVVGLNIDNVPVINKDNFDFDLADIQSVEVLRGPQNILYGRNTMAGLINIYTLSPLSFEGIRASVSYGSQNTYRAALGIYSHSLPVKELGMSLNLYATGTDGFYRNAFNGSRVGRENQWSARWKTVWRPASNVIFENAATLSRTWQHGYPYAPAGSKVVNYNDTCYYRRLSFTDGLTVKHSFSGVDFSSIISFQYLNDDMTLDQDFLPVDYFTLRQKRHEWAVTADFVARGSAGRWHWLGGLFAMGRRTDMSAPVTFGDYGIEQLIEKHVNGGTGTYPIRWDERSLLLQSDFTLPSGGVSAYHQSELRLDQWILSLGLRFDWEQARLRYRSLADASYTIYDATGPGEPVPFQTVPLKIDDSGRLRKDFTQLQPKLSVQYLLPSGAGNIYASATKGYKAGGYNTQMFSDVLQQRLMQMMGMSMLYDVNDIISYNPEKNWNFELGAHLSLWEGRLGADFSAFWIECTDQQITVFPPGVTTGRIMANAGRTRSRGLEAAASLSLDNGLNFRASYGFTDARFRQYDNGREDFAGKHVPYAPNNTLFLSAGYGRSLSYGGFLRGWGVDVSSRGVGRIWWNEANTVSQPFYMTLSARVHARLRPCTVELWADNITATQYNTFYFVSIGNAFLQRGPRMSFGVTLKRVFN